MPLKCKANDCERKAVARGMCLKHWKRHKRNGTVELLPKKITFSVEERRKRANEATRRWWAKNKDIKKVKQRQYNLKIKYGITPEEFAEMVKNQGGVCKICGNSPLERYGKKVLFVDHDHNSGKIRALLCQKCNLGIGHLDTIDLLEKSILYLKEYAYATD